MSITIGEWSDLEVAESLIPTLTVGPWSDLATVGVYVPPIPELVTGPWSELVHLNEYRTTRYVMLDGTVRPLETVLE